ncbi:hypothetical protein NMV45_00605 [Pasteurella multocida]|uniref:hypothetical protein n=1 Tax=Pasteurella multocida TaxID=747 RepID=UPI002A5176E4|nr:hypothetical protein [Pasteurella multocida]MDY0488431.1 hypothetical protein [Pasteurella multocida]MDY0594037.1 hypothetical protein [Pasteurella multocida]MDY0663457.1 hypothetical protein [Pasteurella multocida]MDY0665555.1 hypothetical protein [Pasteurella multocida]
MLDVNKHPIFRAAKAAFPYSLPILSGFLFLGIAYGVYMKALGFEALYPILMALFIYWVIGAAIGALFGSILPFDLSGIEFAMTALFLVIFAEQWCKESSHESALLGLGIAFTALLVVGKTYFLLPTLIGIWFALTLRRVKLSAKLAKVE